MQGWDNAFLTLQQSPIGAGFQQYGISTIYGNISNKIFEMLNIYINQFDAGATAPKIIGEFGVFGILIVLLYLVGWVRIFIAVRRERFKVDKRHCFFPVFIYQASLSFYSRGWLFYTWDVLLIASVLYFISNKVVQKEISYETSH